MSEVPYLLAFRWIVTVFFFFVYVVENTRNEKNNRTVKLTNKYNRIPVVLFDNVTYNKD